MLTETDRQVNLMLTPTQTYRYRTEGYLAVEGVLTPEEIAAGRAIIEEFTDRARSVSASDAVFDLEDDHCASAPHIRRIKSPARAHPFFDRLLRSDRILDMAAADAWPLFRTVTDLDAFDADIVRGRPTLEPRLEPVPVRVPLPLPAATIFELQAAAARKAFA